MGAEFKDIDNGIEVLKKPYHGSEVLSCENSGTTLRLLTGISSLFEEQSILMGDDSLNQRPMKPLINALRELGVDIRDTEGHAPVYVRSKKKGKTCRIDGNVSSQFISSLIISASLDTGSTTVIVNKPLVSRPYIDLTLEMLSLYGIDIDTKENDDEILYRVNASEMNNVDFTVPPDFSSAAFFISAGVLSSNHIKIDDINSELPQADAAIIDILINMGAQIDIQKDNILTKGGKLDAISVDIKDSPDIFPILSVVASLTDGIMIIKGAHHLKYKESDRISTTCEFISLMGGDIEATDDGAIIRSSTLRGDCVINPHGDHRIAMAASIAATFADKPCTILNPDCVSVSYPDFYNDLKKLGVKIKKSS